LDESKWLNDHLWLSEFNWLPEVRSQLDLPERVYVHECTLREAEQAPGISLNPNEKIALAKALDRLNVSSIEIFPVVSPQDIEVAKEIIKLNLKPEVKCLCRWLIKDIDVALDCGTKAVVIENTANPWVNKVVYGFTEEQIISNFVQATRYAKDNGLHATVMPWDTYRCPLPFLERLYKAIVYEGGANRVVVADTAGAGLPWATAHIIKMVRGWVPEVPVEMHCHNEMGMATAAMLSAVIGGASGVHTTLCGYGTRGGNAATEEVSVNLAALLGVETGLNFNKLYYACRLMQDLANVPVSADKPIIGHNLYTYSTGLTIDVFQKVSKAGRPHGVVPIRPEFIGHPGYRVELGKMSGKSAVKYKLKELGIEVPEMKLAEILTKVKEEGALRKNSLSNDVISEIVQQVCRAK